MAINYKIVEYENRVTSTEVTFYQSSDQAQSGDDLLQKVLVQEIAKLGTLVQIKRISGVALTTSIIAFCKTSEGIEYNDAHILVSKRTLEDSSPVLSPLVYVVTRKSLVDYMERKQKGLDAMAQEEFDNISEGNVLPPGLLLLIDKATDPSEIRVRLIEEGISEHIVQKFTDQQLTSSVTGMPANDNTMYEAIESLNQFRLMRA